MYAHKEEMKMLLWQFANVTFKATKQLKNFYYKGKYFVSYSEQKHKMSAL